jgi:hypothetical protein
MSIESGADYLRRLKQDQGQPLTQASSNTNVVPTQPEKAGSSERRQCPRYKCQGSAEFRVDGSDVRTWGTFTDLSMHGCYIEMTATYPVGAVVNLGLGLGGLHVDVKGEVRVSYPFLGIGVAFRDVSEESVARLREMVRSLLPAAHLGISATGKAIAQPASPTSARPSLPLILDTAAALQAVVEHFEGHRILTQEEFVLLLRRSQSSSR